MAEQNGLVRWPIMLPLSSASPEHVLPSRATTGADAERLALLALLQFIVATLDTVKD